jgi:hypothetical protein
LTGIAEINKIGHKEITTMLDTWQTIERYDLAGVRNLIIGVSDFEGMSIYQMAKKAGLSHTTLWAILHRKNRKDGNSVHRNTLKRLGDGLGYRVWFDSKEGTVQFSKPVNRYPGEVESGTVFGGNTSDQQSSAQPTTSEIDAIRSLW